MLRFISHLANAAVFVSLAALTWNIGVAQFRSGVATHSGQQPGASARPSAVDAAKPPLQAKVLPLPLPLQAPSSDPVSTSEAKSLEPAASAITTLPLFAPGFAQNLTEQKSAEKSATGAPKGTSTPSAVKSEPRSTNMKLAVDAIVPPIRRQRPKPGSITQASGKSTQQPLQAQFATKNGKKPTKQVAVVPRAIDLSGRSALGAGTKVRSPQPRAACNIGLRFDDRLLRCVPLPSPTAATQLKIRGAKSSTR